MHTKMSISSLSGWSFSNIHVGLLGIRMDRVPNAWIREVCRVTQGVEERIDEGVLWGFSHVEKMEKDRIAKRV